MTLKTRLAVMMFVLIGAVVALQFFLLQREQRLLAERLTRFGRDIESSTRALAGEAAWRAEAGDSLSIETVLERIRRTGELAACDSAEYSVVVRVGADSATVDVMPLPADLQGIVRGHAPEGAAIVSERITQIRHRLPAGPPDGRAPDDSSRVGLLFLGTTVEGEGLFAHAASRDGVAEEDGKIVKIHLAMPGPPGGSGSSLELLYPVSDLTEELERARRRSGLWLAALLGVGATGAVLVAVQFTRPIKALEGSFGRVVEGDLDVRIEPERPDEIGRLTTSFNDMVGRLRDSRAMETRLSEAERLAAVGRLAAGVAHEVRNPLNTMLLTMQQLGRKSAPPPDDPGRPRFDGYVASVTGELERLERLVGTFLELSRADALALGPVDVGASVRAAATLFAPEAETAGARIETDLEGALEIEADAARLPTVWNNLISNALRAAGDGGTVRLAARALDEGVEVTVTDDGAGIVASDLPKIWEPFWSGRRDGTGLGLALVRAVVERHGGEVEATSDSETGTTVRVFLPRRPAATA